MNSEHPLFLKLYDWLLWLAEFHRLADWNISPTKFVFLATIANIALYHLPLFSFAADNMDALSFNGVKTLFTLFVAIFFVTAILLFFLFMLSHYLRALQKNCRK